MPHVPGVRGLERVRVVARIPAPMLVGCPHCGARRLEPCDVPNPRPGRVHAARIEHAHGEVLAGRLEPLTAAERFTAGQHKAQGVGFILAALLGAAVFPGFAREVLEASARASSRRPLGRDGYGDPAPSVYMAELLEGGRWWWWCGDCDERGEASGASVTHLCGEDGERCIPRPDPARDSRAVRHAAPVQRSPAGLLEAPEGEP